MEINGCQPGNTTEGQSKATLSLLTELRSASSEFFNQFGSPARPEFRCARLEL